MDQNPCWKADSTLSFSSYFLPFMELEGAFLCLQEPAIGPGESNPHPTTVFPKVHFNIILPSMRKSSEWSFPRLSNHFLCGITWPIKQLPSGWRTGVRFRTGTVLSSGRGGGSGRSVKLITHLNLLAVSRILAASAKHPLAHSLLI
jgi:hypothetical protein